MADTTTIDCCVCGDGVREERCPHTDAIRRERDDSQTYDIEFLAEGLFHVTVTATSQEEAEDMVVDMDPSVDWGRCHVLDIPGELQIAR